MMRLIRYEASLKRDWDEFVDSSRNATFLFKRDYMDYHSDRFKDYSFMAYKGNSLRALLPCNLTEGEEGKVLHSHQGLTYGGWLLPPRHLSGEEVLELFRQLADICSANEIVEVDYKPMPYIYSRMPSDEDRYALFRCGAIRTGCELSSAIRLRHNPGFNSLQRRHLKKASQFPGICIEEIKDNVGIEEFSRMLERCLEERHGVRPVHSAEELKLLHSRFPRNIRFIVCRDQGVMSAGVCLYLTDEVIHSQYICSTPEGREKGLLTYLFDYVINQDYGETEYFDFGTSTEQGGTYLNTGLLRQKFSLGGSGVVYERFSLDPNLFLSAVIE